MSIDISRNNTALRSYRTLMCSGCWGALRGTGPRATGAGARFFVVRGPVSRDRSLILFILFILAILLQTIAIKVLTDLFSWLRLRSIDIQVRWTWSRVLVAAVGRGPVPRMRFSCLKQDLQDLQDGIRLGTRRKGLEDLNVYRHQQA